MRIQVQDGGSPPKSDVADLVINIQNINEAPNFIGDCSSGCTVSIAEGNAVNRLVKKLSATDPDTTKQCTLKYHIVSSDSYYFKIHETSGQISTQRAIDRERKEVYSLHVEVKDCDSPPLKDKVIVTVRATDINDNKPQFPVSKYMATVLENKPINTHVTTVKATGECSGMFCFILRLTHGWVIYNQSLRLSRNSIQLGIGYQSKAMVEAVKKQRQKAPSIISSDENTFTLKICFVG